MSSSTDLWVSLSLVAWSTAGSCLSSGRTSLSSSSGHHSNVGLHCPHVCSTVRMARSGLLPELPYWAVRPGQTGPCQSFPYWISCTRHSTGERVSKRGMNECSSSRLPGGRGPYCPGHPVSRTRLAPLTGQRSPELRED